MREVILNHGHVALVDDADAGLVMKYRWRSWKQRKTGVIYALATTPRSEGHQNIRMHNLIAGQLYVDHRDGNGLNNQRGNLRPATNQQNSANAPGRGGSSKYKGVCFRRRSGRWRAYIRVNGAQIDLGEFRTEVEAAIAYNSAAAEHFGEFARPNKIA